MEVQTLAYFDTAAITAINRFLVQAAGAVACSYIVIGYNGITQLLNLPGE
jgi:hypothetical protein